MTLNKLYLDDNNNIKLKILTCHWVLYDGLSFLRLEVSCLFVVEELFPHQECLYM